MPFDPIHIIIFLSTGLGFYAFQARERKQMLTFKLIADALFATYLFLLGGYTGAMGALIATLGGAIQVATPPHLMGKTLPYRLGSACLLSVAGVYFLSQSVTDVYPFIGVVLSRFVELFKSTIILRIGFFCAAIPWLTYNFVNEFYLAVGGGILMMVAMTLGILRNERRLPRDPVP